MDLETLQTQVEILKTKLELAELKGQSSTPQNSQWEYKSIRFDYLGRGITQEFNILDIDGKRVEGWWFSNTHIKTLPDLLQLLGAAGWEMISHVVNQDLQGNNVTLHYMNFKRLGVSASNELADETLSAAREASAGNRKLFVIA